MGDFVGECKSLRADRYFSNRKALKLFEDLIVDYGLVGLAGLSP